MPRPRAYLKIATPPPGRQPLDTISINPDYDQIVYSSLLPGGFGGLSAAIHEQHYAGQGQSRLSPRFAGFPQTQPFVHLELWQGQRQLWEGRGVQLDGIGSAPTAFVGLGYAAAAGADNPLLSRDALLRSGGVCLAAALRQGAPAVRIGMGARWQDPGGLHALAEFDGKTAAQVADQVGREGNGGALYDFALWEGLQATLTARVAPLVPDYVLPYSGRLKSSELGAGSYGTVYVDYTATDGTTQRTAAATNPAFAAFFGVARAQVIPGGATTQAGAQRFGTTALAQVSVPAFRISYAGGDQRGLLRPGGSEAPIYHVRAGQWVRLGEPGGVLLPIVKAEVDLGQSTIAIDLGGPPPTGEELVRELLRRAVHFGRDTNPNTGAGR